MLGSILQYEVNTAGWGYWFADYPALLWLWAGWLVFLTAIYAWATMAFGIRFSNLTYRGVLTNGPYRFTRHPAYVAKNLFWWCSTLPFLVTSGSPVDMIRNTVVPRRGQRDLLLARADRRGAPAGARTRSTANITTGWRSTAC